MITGILDYIDNDYGNVRAACGLSAKELKDTELALVLYKNRLNLALNGISGIYAPSTVSQTLQEIFDPLTDSDPMYSVIQTYSIYVVADCVLNTVGLKAYKTIADGKSHIGRFSPESTYESAVLGVKNMLTQWKQEIDDLLDVTVDQTEILTVVKPAVNVITGV